MVLRSKWTAKKLTMWYNFTYSIMKRRQFQASGRHNKTRRLHFQRKLFDISDTLVMPAYSWGLGMAKKTIRGGFCPRGALRIRKMLNMVTNNRVDTTKLITHRFSGFEKVEDAFKIMDKKPSDLIKPVVFVE